jgi:Ice-binding-like
MEAHMYAHNLPMHLVRALAPPRLAAAALVTLTLLSAACSKDPVSSINAPSLLFNSSNSRSAASSGFAVLANQAVTCTNGSVIGDVGTFQAKPTGSVTLTSCPVTGTVHVGDGVAKQAFNAFVAAYNALAPQVGHCDVAHTLTGTLAAITLTPGTYCISSEAKTGTLTLNGGGAYTFLVSGALTGTSFTVVLANGAQACDVTWLTTAAATLTDSHFVGTILAAAAITLTRGTFNGNAWAGASGVGDVTITGTAVTGCAGRKGEDKDKGKGEDKEKCNQGVGNGSEGCDPGHSDHHNSSNDENGGTPGDPGRQGGHH